MPLRSNRRASVRAFTLIELLVVVAIIGVLVSILVPSLKAARDQAKQVVCLTHMKAQYDAASAYADENRDLFISGIVNDGPPNFTGDRTLMRNFRELGLAPQYWLPYLGYQVPLKHVTSETDLELRKWQRLASDGNFGAYRSDEVAQGRMGDAFASIEVYQCPSFPETSLAGSGSIGTVELDYLTNAMPSPFTVPNVRTIADLATTEYEFYTGVGVGTVYYFDKRKRSSIGRPADIMYIGEADEAVARNDIQGITGDGIGGAAAGRGDRLSFIPNAIFIGGHLPYATQPRIDNDFDDGQIRKRHPGGSNLMFFDGHGETMSYRKQDPGDSYKLAIRLRYFSDPSNLPPRWQ